MSTKLFDGSDESDNDFKLSTNKEYAKTYNKLRQKELLKKFKDRELTNSDSETSSDSDSSDEGETVDPKFDQEFFKTLASLKSKDPAIYDKNTKFFEGFGEDGDDASASNTGDGEKGDNQGKVGAKEKKSKPVTLKDYERQILLEKGGKFEDDTDDEKVAEEYRPASPSAVEEERRLKAEFKKVMNTDVDSEEEGFGGILKRRVKTKEETEKEEADFVKWLAGKQEHIEEEVGKKLEPLKNYWQSSNLSQSERFLRDYILNNGYVETNLNDIPTYEEIVGDNAPLSEDEADLEKQAEFEYKYNFRFEEPDSEFIARYPRTIEQSVRRSDDKRKQKRLEIKERKEREKQQKMKELELVKEMKRKEIEEKIEKLKMVTGNEELGFKLEELDDDFDPETHDRRMQEIFNDEYYQVNEGDEKPECPSDIEELQIEDWDNYDPQKAMPVDDYEPHCEDEDFNMDCEYDPAAAKEQLQKELIENTKKRRNRKGRRNRFMEMIQAEKPPFKPEDEKTYAEYIDEYYKLDCEDIIGDTPCRFKYVETTPNDFGLTIEEILLAKNKELNQWASLKKAIQIRPDHVDRKEQRFYQMKARNEELKRKIFQSLYGECSDEEPEEMKGRKKAQSAKSSAEANNDDQNQSNPSKKSKKKRKHKSQETTETKLNEIDGLEVELKRNTIEPDEEAPEKKQKLDVETAVQDLNNTDTSIANNNTDMLSQKKKKKKKKSKQKKNEENSPQVSNSVAPNSTPDKISNEAKSIAELSSKKKKSDLKAKNKKPSFTQDKMKNGKSLGVHGKKKHKSTSEISRKNKVGDSKISDERLKAYGINPKKFHKKKIYGSKKKD